MKVAILLSGHVRTYKETFENFRSNFISNMRESGVDFDIYTSIWDNTGGKLNSAGQSTKLSDLKIDVNRVVKDLEIIYMPKVIDVEDSKIYTMKSRRDLNKFLRAHPKLFNDKVKWDIPQHVEGAMFQLYKINRCFNLIKNPSDYDVIIKHRFDAISRDKLDWSDKSFVDMIKNNVCVLTRHKRMPDGTKNWGDIIVYGPPDLMSVFCNTYNFLMDDKNNIQFSKSPDSGIEIFSITHAVNGIFRKEKIDNRLVLCDDKTSFRPQLIKLVR